MELRHKLYLFERRLLKRTELHVRCTLSKSSCNDSNPMSSYLAHTHTQTKLTRSLCTTVEKNCKVRVAGKQQCATKVTLIFSAIWTYGDRCEKKKIVWYTVTSKGSFFQALCSIWIWDGIPLVKSLYRATNNIFVPSLRYKYVTQKTTRCMSFF